MRRLFCDKNDNSILQINEEHQTITLKVSQMAWWTDERIKINSSHFFWDDNNQKKGISLKGKFVQDCLWTPKLSLWGFLAADRPKNISSQR